MAVDLKHQGVIKYDRRTDCFMHGELVCDMLFSGRNCLLGQWTCLHRSRKLNMHVQHCYT